MSPPKAEMDHAHEAEDLSLKFVLRCEHCNEKFEVVFTSPMATKCSKCGGLFDARLQLYKQLREYFKENVEAK
jgi:DNA polymerase II large subunit